MIISSAKVHYIFLSAKFNSLFVINFFFFFVNLLKIVCTVVHNYLLIPADDIVKLVIACTLGEVGAIVIEKLELAFFRYFLTFAFKSFNTPTMTHEGYFRKERTEAAQP